MGIGNSWEPDELQVFKNMLLAISLRLMPKRMARFPSTCETLCWKRSQIRTTGPCC